MLKRILIALLFILATATTFAQLSKKEQKKLKSLKKQYDFVSINNSNFSTPKNCDKIIVGSYLRGPSDGGGGFNKGITNLKYVTLDGNVVQQISDYDITLQFGRDDSNYRYIMRKISRAGKVGLMDNCGNEILAPTYDHINLFNKEGIAVAFLGNSIDLINAEGKSILEEKIPYKVNYDDFWRVPKPAEITNLQVIAGRIFKSDENGKYAIYDIENKTNVTDFKYTYLSTNTMTFNDKTYIKAGNTPYMTLVDLSSGEELVPYDKFYNVDGFTKLNDTDYVIVIANEEPYNRNLFNPATQELLLPTDFKLYDVKGYVEGRPNLLKFCGGVSKGCGIFDFEKNAFLLEPQDEFRGIRTSIGHDKVMELNTLLINLNEDRTFAFFDLDTNSLLDLYISGKRLNLSTSKILEFDDGAKIFRVDINPSPTTATHYYTLYDEDWKEIYISKPRSRVKFNKEEGVIEVYEKNEAGEVLEKIRIGSNGEIQN